MPYFYFSANTILRRRFNQNALMNFYYLLIAGLALVVFTALQVVISKKLNNKADLISKVLSLLLVVLFTVRYLGDEILIRETVGLTTKSPFGENGALSLISVLVIWMLIASEILLFTYPFFKDKVKSLNVAVKYFALPVTIIALITLPILAKAFDGEKSNAFFWRDVVLAVEVALAVSVSIRYAFTQQKTYYTKKETVSAILVILGMFAVSMPSYALQVLFGYTTGGYVIDDFTFVHRLYLYGAFLLPIIIHFIFVKYDYDQKRYALIFISIAAMISYCYSYTFAELLSLRNWPLHLCNTAMFIIPLCLIFKMKRLYYFTLFINVLGAFLAMIMPTSEENILAAGQMNFWINHYCAFYMPILLISLKIFERPKLKAFIYSLIAFAVYYALILVINAYFGDTDFFFINSDFVASKLGKWAEDLRLITFEFNIGERPIVIYPVYQSLYFSVYIVLSLAMWFMYEQIFIAVDLYAEMAKRNVKIKADAIALQIQMNGRSIDEPMNLENTNKLILKDFCKRYSTSDVYAVKDANLEIEGGQIFGFLGPNGAGKSTIIKSIVGIQTISSGSIEVCGYDVEKQPVGAKMQLGFVPDHYALYENLTGREYVNYIADLYKVSAEDRTERINEYVERFNLAQAFDNKIKTYSHGMKQKITIMSALVHNPKLWILDEPLTGLDPESIFQVKECMKHHAEKGNIVFFSSHLIDVVESVCDKIAIIKKGNVLCSKTVKEVVDSGVTLENFYMSMIENSNVDSVKVVEEGAVNG